MFEKQIRIPALDWQTGLMWALTVALLPALYMELTGDFPGRVLFYGQDEDSWLAGVMLDAHTAIFATTATAWVSVNDTLVSIRNFFFA